MSKTFQTINPIALKLNLSTKHKFLNFKNPKPFVHNPQEELEAKERKEFLEPEEEEEVPTWPKAVVVEAFGGFSAFPTHLNPKPETPKLHHVELVTSASSWHSQDRRFCLLSVSLKPGSF